MKTSQVLHGCVVCTDFRFQEKLEVTDEVYPDDFVIDNYYRFEGASNRDDSAIVYAISSKDGLKGSMADAYGVYADSLTTEMISKLKIVRHR